MLLDVTGSTHCVCWGDMLFLQLFISGILSPPLD